jgi:hypothetical protein
MITVAQMKMFVNEEIAKHLTARAKGLTLMNLGPSAPSAKQKDVDKLRAYLEGLAGEFEFKRGLIIEREAKKRRERIANGPNQVPVDGVPENAQE